MSRKPPHNSSVDLRLDDIKQTIWLTRPDLQTLSEGDQDRFELWLHRDGPAEYAALGELGNRLDLHSLSAPITGSLPTGTPPVTRYMRTLWLSRPDLIEAFDLATPEGQQAFSWWYFIHGGELDQPWLLTPAQYAYLNQRAEGWLDTPAFPVTRLMAEIWSRRPDLQQAFSRTSQEATLRLIHWFYRHCVIESTLLPTLDSAHIARLLQPLRPGETVPRILFLFWLLDRELRQRFPEPEAGGLPDWAQGDEAAATLPLYAALLKQAHAAADQTTDQTAGQQRPPARPKRPARLKPGVNLIGYAKGQLGIGEDVRMAALACEAAGIPYSVFNVSPGHEVSEGDNSLADRLSDTLPHDTNLFCMTGIETARLAAIHGHRLFDGRRSIGYWPWELPAWPEAWHHAYRLVDEIWASSRFIQQAFAHSSPKPVRLMPMAVTVDATDKLQRRDFGLPAQPFLFVFSFDFLSSLARKNPYACIRAFKTAFPAGDEPVGLVIKAMRARPENPLWRKVLREQQRDRRIHLIAETLDRGALLDLYRACDCFVSLHRSEGYGRGLAEALLLGKPVIATGYSGNVDFCLPPLGHPVKYRLTTVKPGDYPYGEGLQWADPSVTDAARLMQQVAAADNPAPTDLYQQRFAPSVIGRQYAEQILR